MKVSASPQTNTLRFVRPLVIGLILVIIGFQVAGITVWAQTLQQPCAEAAEACPSVRGQLTIEQAQMLQARGLSLSAYVAIEVLKILIFSGIWLGVGALILVRKSHDWMALITAFMLMTFPALWDDILTNLARAYPALDGVIGGLAYLINLALPFFVALFPNGQWVPRWTRWVVLAFVISPVLLTFAPESQLSTSAQIEQLQLLFSFGLLFLLFIAQVIRYRNHSTSVERLQARWVIMGVGAAFAIVIAMIVVWALNILPSASEPFAGLVSEFIYQLAVVMMPLSVAVSILRYRLFDIDVIIRRTLQYSVLSGLLGLTYFGLVIVLQNLLSVFNSQPSEFVTVLSTLAIAALFFPLRNRVQEFIDKRFFRKKYDAQKVLAEFAATCRDETDLDKLIARLAEVIDETLQPEKVSVWIKPTADSGRRSAVGGQSSTLSNLDDKL